MAYHFQCLPACVMDDTAIFLVSIVHDMEPSRVVKILRMLKYGCIGEATIPLILQPQGAGQRTDKEACQWDVVFLWHCQESNWQPAPAVPSALRFHLATATDGFNESPRYQQVS